MGDPIYTIGVGKTILIETAGRATGGITKPYIQNALRNTPELISPAGVTLESLIKNELNQNINNKQCK